MPPPCSYNRYSWLKYTLNIIRLSKVLMLKQGKFLGPNVNMNYTKLHEIGNLQMKCKQSLWKLIYFKLQFKMCDGMTKWRNDRMTRNSQHGTQKPSAWYALGLKTIKQRQHLKNNIIHSSLLLWCYCIKLIQNWTVFDSILARGRLLDF